MKKIYLGLLCSLFLVGGSNTMVLATENEQPETIQSTFVVFPEVDITPEELEISVENDGSLYPSNPLARGGTIPTGEKN